jgi:glycosyltransferase involved in cell wall biosynthesis
MQVIVAANGCTDNTAAIARAFAPQVLVIEQTEGSKPRAMNAAKALAVHPICIFLDADVQCTYRSLAAVAQTLTEPGVMAASPALQLDLSRSSWLVKAYYRVWLNLPYITDRMVGSGCFGLSEQALQRIGSFPSIIGDDIWIRSQFTYDERRNVAIDLDGYPVYFLVSPPRSLIDQVRVEARRRIGNMQVDALLASDHQAANYRGAHGLSDIVRTGRKGASWTDMAVYVAAKIAVVLRAQWTSLGGAKTHWERDLAAREI